MKTLMLSAVALLAVCSTNAQTFTMSNNCTDMLKQMESYNRAQLYDSVLLVNETFVQKCKAKDAKWKGGTEMAHAYNGLEQYNSALDASNAALKANKTWIAAYFERAVAYAGLGMIAESKADYEQIVNLSAKNENQESRSTIYAMLADINYKQGEKDSAYAQIDEAISISKRPEYFIQKGDFYYKDGDYDNAFGEYDKAVAAGKADVEMYGIRSAQRLRIYEKKYGTENINELAKKMTSEEKRLCCSEFDKLKGLGYRNMKFDLTYTFLCD